MYPNLRTHAAPRPLTAPSPTLVCPQVWELRVSNLWPILRMYPNLRLDMMEHVRNRTLVGLATGQRDVKTSSECAWGCMGLATGSRQHSKTSSECAWGCMGLHGAAWGSQLAPPSRQDVE
jgi:hypothetical protein